MTTFEQYLENLMGMKKAEIINEGITWGIWANTEGNKAELMKWKKVLLAGMRLVSASFLFIIESDGGNAYEKYDRNH